MTLRNIRAAARAVGRRTALRYLALGAGGALLAACTGKEHAAGPASSPSSSAGTPAPATSPSPSASPAGSPSASASAPAAGPSGITGRAFAEFVKGAWAIRTTLPGSGPGGRKADGRATIGADGSWSIVWTGALTGTWTGRWSLTRGRLDLKVLTGPREIADPDTSFAQNVPETVDGPVSRTLPWYPLGANDMFGRLEIAYNGGELRIRHLDLSGAMSIHMCSRT
ncbi:hypothetical protein [Streptomyces bambusae]|uniref:Lipoprotein n=1 Tax=Streptomyces bambusae TaxID=1550616 RepID=A0ABS6ZDG5_9ACTN|nr:hypothetical protein [Streptomyces bambusae]MBW5485802.1 hypothetical protein [Streptomyces bambusae]